MSEEIKKSEEIEKLEEAAELAEGDLENVAGGKSYYESHSNVANAPAPIAGGPVPSPKIGAVKKVL